MNDLFIKEIFTWDDIKPLIENNFEESINLEFKEARSLDHTDKKKDEIAKDVSAFANSAGGIILFGIKEVNHKAQDISFIDGNIYTKEWLEQIITSRIHRKIPNLLIFPIRFENDVSKTVYVVKIPESVFAPHMMSTKRYYKRYNFESVSMEEYEVRNLYQRANRTLLQIESINGIGLKRNEIEESHKFLTRDMTFQIQNIGNAVEKDYKLLFKVIGLKKCFIRPFPQYSQNNFTRTLLEDSSTVFSFSCKAPIFPNEVLTIGEAVLGISEFESHTFTDEMQIEISLQYTSGKDETKFSIHKLFYP